MVSIVPDQPQNIGEMSYKNCVRLLTECAASIFYNPYCWPGRVLLVLPNAAEVQAALDANEVELFNGTPDSHPNGFVVNCPAPVVSA